MFFNGIANNVYAEMHNAKGRADLIVDLENRRIVFELKFADRAQECAQKLEEAVEQVKVRDYGHVWPKKELLRLALVFNGSKEVRAITHYQEV